MSTDLWLSPDTLTAIGREVERSRLKYPGNAHMLAAIVESTGSLARALLCGCGPSATDRAAKIGKEALQVAAIALRLYEEGDVTFSDWKRAPVAAREIKQPAPHPDAGDADCG